MTARRALAVFLPCLVLAACGGGENDPGPGGVTNGEARMLDEAAEMLDERRAQLPPEPGARPVLDAERESLEEE